MSRPGNAWIDDWEIGEEPERERAVSLELVKCFCEFWDALGLDGRRKPPETAILEPCKGWTWNEDVAGCKYNYQK
jgi:hypothetical protein